MKRDGDEEEMQRLQVIHSVLQRRTIDPTVPQLFSLPHDSVLVCRAATASFASSSGEKLGNVAPTPLASQVSVVRWRDEADSLGRTGEHVADRVGERLDGVSVETNLVVNNVVVSGTSRALEATMSYKRLS